MAIEALDGSPKAKSGKREQILVLLALKCSLTGLSSLSDIFFQFSMLFHWLAFSRGI